MRSGGTVNVPQGALLPAPPPTLPDHFLYLIAGKRVNPSTFLSFMFIQKLRLYALLLTASLTASGADKGGGSITLADALARTLRGSPELAAYSYELRSAEARVLQAGVRPNPEMSVQIENPTGSGPYKSGEQMENTMTLSQLIELGGKRPARISEAQAAHAVLQWDYQVKRVEALQATALAFIDVLSAQRRLALAEDVLKVTREALSATEQSVGVGKANVVDAIRANVTAASTLIDVEQARRDIASAHGHLAAQWGARSADFNTVRGNLNPLRTVPSLDSLGKRLLGSPDLVRWTAEKERRTALLRKEQSLAQQDITVQAGPRIEGKAQDATFVAGFSIPLPINNRNQGGIAQARANLGKLVEEKRASETRAFAALNEAFQNLTGAQREITILEESVIPGAQNAEKQLVEGYAAGRFTQFEVLDARRTLNAARVQQLRALADYQKAWARIDSLTALPRELPQLPSAKSRRQ